MNEYFEIKDDAKLKTSELLQKCRDKFPMWSYWDDEELDKDFPKPKVATTRYFKKNIEADEENANKSANDLEAEKIEGITLRERIILENQYFEETGGHLDKENITLCTGSRYRGGYVPYADWNGEFYIGWYDAGDRTPDLRSRTVLDSNSLTLKPLESLDLDSAIKMVKEAGYQVSKIM